MLTPFHRTSITALALIAALSLVGCSGVTPAQSEATPQATTAAPAEDQTVEDERATDSTAAEDADVESAFAERDAFFEAQQFSQDGSPLVARTEAQKQLIAEQRAWTESQGGTWTDESEPIILALGSDTCETGILNQHRIDAALLQQTIVSSPLVDALIPADATSAQRAAYERNLASTSVFAAGFLCPDDAEAWNAAFQASYPG